MNPAPPPPEVLTALGLSSWPTEQATRAALTRSLRVRDEGLWLQLVVWAHRASDHPVAIAEWAERLGVHPSTVKGWRAAVPALGALEVGGPGPRADPEKGQTRAQRAERAGKRGRGRPRKAVTTSAADATAGAPPAPRRTPPR